MYMNCAELYQPPLNPTLAPRVMAGLDPAILARTKLRTMQSQLATTRQQPPDGDGLIEPSDDVVGPMRMVRQRLGRLVLLCHLGTDARLRRVTPTQTLWGAFVSELPADLAAA